MYKFVAVVQDWPQECREGEQSRGEPTSFPPLPLLEITSRMTELLPRNCGTPDASLPRFRREGGGSRTNFPCHHHLEEEGERKARTGGGFSAISGAVTAHVASEETHSVPTLRPFSSKSKVVSTFSRPSCCLQGRCSEETFTH